MADKKDKKRTPVKKPAPKATAEKAPAASAAKKGSAPAKATAAKKATTKAAAPAKRAVARPITRVAVRPAPEKPREEGPVEAATPAPAPKPKAEPRPLPTAPPGTVPLIGTDGSVGSIPLPPSLTQDKQRAGVLFQALDIAASNAHLGTSATKNRARVAGGGAKPWRQKGTGRARQGSTRAPHWRHGGVAFGPNDRRYQRRIPEKMRREAFAEALAARAAIGRVLVYEGMRFEDDRPRTKTVVEWIGKLGDAGKVLLVTPEVDETTARAAANAQGVAVSSVGALRTADVLTHDTLIVRRDALDALASRVSQSGGGA